MEIGPYRLKDKEHLEYNDGSWDEFANVMFVDNPVGTGFSYVDGNSYVHDLPEMADQFIVFLEKWFALFPEYEHDDVSSLCTQMEGKTDQNSSISLENLTLANTSHTSRKQSWIATRRGQSTDGN